MLSFNFTDFIAGCFGGICGLVVAHPFDTIKVRQQTYGTNFYTTSRRTFKHEGIVGFYKGALFPLFTIGPSNALLFGIYGNLVKNLQHNNKQDHPTSLDDTTLLWHIFLAGNIGGIFQTLFFCPVELIKTVMQTSTSTKGTWKMHNQVIYKNSYDAFMSIYRKRGIAGLYRGNVAMMWRDVPTAGIYTLSYEMLVHWYFSTSSMPMVAKEMIAGGVAGIMSSVIVLPIDVVKNTMQADNPEKPLFKGTWDYFKHLYRTEGLRVFGRGVMSLSVTCFARHSAVFFGYEFIEKLLNDKF